MASEGSMDRDCLCDRFSNLPDALRLQILSLLPRKYAIRTGALSTKWKDLWKYRFPHQSTLRFDERFADGKSHRDLLNEIQHQMNELRDKKMDMFMLYFYAGKENKHTVSNWISQAVESGVEECCLDLSQGHVGWHPGRLAGRRAKFELKERVFKKNSIVVLNLSYCRLERTFSFKHFQNLEFVSLKGLNVNDSMLEGLTVHCQLLKSLEIRDCCWLQHFRIPGHSQLQRLLLVHCWKIRKVEILAPRLSSFNFFSRYPVEVSFLDVQSLKNVIMVWFEDGFWSSPDNWEHMWRSLDGLEILTIGSLALQYVVGGSGNPPWISLSNLRELHVIMTRTMDGDLMLLYTFLARCLLPCIERLFIELAVNTNGTHANLILGNHPPTVVFCHLRVVKMTNFGDQLNHLVMLGFLLARAVVVEIIVLIVPPQYENHDLGPLSGFISRMRRASACVRIWLLRPSQDNGRICPTNVSPMHI